MLAGVTKAGTTALFSYLAQHPQIFCPQQKELNHYSPLVYGRAAAAIESYAAHFRDAPAGARRVDASPFYFVGGERVADAIGRDLGRPWILLSLRDPSDRLWSSYAFKQSKGRVQREQSFAEFVAHCIAQYEAGTDLLPENSNAITLRTGRYADFLPAWVDRFGDSVLLVRAEQLQRDPRATMAGVYAGLQVDPAFADVLDVTPRNVTHQPRSVAVRRLGTGASKRLSTAFARWPALRRGAETVYRMNVKGTGAKPTTADRQLADAFYAEPNARLARYLTEAGMALPSWLGDSAAGAPPAR